MDCFKKARIYLMSIVMVVALAVAFIFYMSKVSEITVEIGKEAKTKYEQLSNTLK